MLPRGHGAAGLVLGLDGGDARLLLVQAVRLARGELPEATPASIRACWFASRWSMRGVAVPAAKAPNEAIANATPPAKVVNLCMVLSFGLRLNGTVGCESRPSTTPALRSADPELVKAAVKIRETTCLLQSEHRSRASA
jgi:hypothetical protein